MAAPIEIGALDEGDISDLANALAARGLVGTRSKRNSGSWLEVHDAHEQTDRLLCDVTAAVSDWLADRHGTTLELRIGDRIETVSAREDLGEVLRSRVSSPARSGADKR